MSLLSSKSDKGSPPAEGESTAKADDRRGARRGGLLLAAVMALSTSPAPLEAHALSDSPPSSSVPERLKALQAEIQRRSAPGIEQPWGNQRIAQFFPDFPNTFPNFPNFANTFPNWLNYYIPN
jgi:hypothetical protein